MARLRSVIVAALLAGVMLPRHTAAFVTFETGQVRPLALTPDRQTLLALNTPDARLEIFRVDGGDLVRRASVPVGLEPIAVAARSNAEVWVVNHLSDSVSIIDIAAPTPHVVRTLLVGDEPRDVVFAGPVDDEGFFKRGFITTARRGQNVPESVPPNLTTPGMPRGLVYVFDAGNLGTGLGGTPETIIELFGDSPRALAASADGRLVYAAIFQSGNQTTTVTEAAVCDGGADAAPCTIDGVHVPGGLPDDQVPGGLPAPNANGEGIRGPEVGLIVKYDAAAGAWQDELGRNWTNAVRFRLPDWDVFRIDAMAPPPLQTGAFAHAGTVLFNMAVNPNTGTLYIANTEAVNQVRFEGPGNAATTVRGHLHEARITVIDGTSVAPRHLNKHIATLPQGYRTQPMPADVKDASLATPMDLLVASDGTIYVAAFGSSTVGVFDATELEANSFTPDAADHIALSGGGPAGLALDESNHRLYVLTRFDNAVKVVDTLTRTEIGAHPLPNPEPPSVIAGRRFLYDARFTSSNGEASCAGCHLFADFDGLAWDLGNPDDVVKPNFNPLGPTGSRPPFHPLKGPMTTQTLRGMVSQGPMHWRGDRTGATSAVEESKAFDASLAFTAFNVAFDSLLGRDEGEISAADMQAFTDFALQIVPPPNPIRPLDNQLVGAQARGRQIFLDRRLVVDGAANCSGCHTLNSIEGKFGTFGQSTFEDESQEFKVPQLKNAYQKVGMFGTPATAFAHILPEDAAYHGDQVRGFGFLHDGSLATVFDFLRAEFFALSDAQRSDLEQFMFAFDTMFAPIVGQQITLTSDTVEVAGARADLLIARARSPFVLMGYPGATECDLVAKGIVGGTARGYLLDPASGRFRSDRAVEATITDAELRGLATADGGALTYTCVPPGEGGRIGLDRDSDTLFDQDEIDGGSDPADPYDPFPTPPATPTRTRPPGTSTPTPTPTNTPSPGRPTAGATRTATPTATVTATRTPNQRGDANCDGVVDLSDTDATCTAMFDSIARAACDADCNRDGVVSGPDVTCVVEVSGEE